MISKFAPVARSLIVQVKTKTSRSGFNRRLFGMDQQDAQSRFIEAMKAVYGQIDSLTTEDAENWNPPENPGAGGHRGRYLWTDAFGVVNFVTLFRETGFARYLVLAKRLAKTVHDVLGKTRDGKEWLRGASEQRPLDGGLRIGKASASGPDGDGQYHHYLTLWMFALNCLSLACADPALNDLAIQLAKAIHPHFVFRERSGDIRMVWKVSMDMQTVLVPTEGHLDAATGYVIYRLLQETAEKHGRQKQLLGSEVEDYSRMMEHEGKMSPSGDALDLGMGLWICQLRRNDNWAADWAEKALQVARRILHEEAGLMNRSFYQRLAFREFGACLGISCYGGDDYLNSRVAAIIEYWESRSHDDPDDHLRPISEVMCAAALIPGGKQLLLP